MIIRSTRVDRYVFDSYIQSSRTAQEWTRYARSQAEWFDIEIFADFYLCFYQASPEIDGTAEAPPFHRWIVDTLRRQYFYQSIHPRTIGSVNASFNTALKALMWLTDSYEHEVKQREKDKQALFFGINSEEGSQGEQSLTVGEQLSEKQLRKLELVGYTLQQGKRNAEEKQAAMDRRPLVAEEIRQLKNQITELQEEMRTEFTRRNKLRQKLKKAEDELDKREKQHQRLLRQEKETFNQMEEELGQWLNQSLKQTLSSEDRESLFLSDLFEASQRLANRTWGSELGRLHRQAFEQYLQWVDRLKRHPDLLAFLEEVGRNVHQFKAKRRRIRTRLMPETYDDLRQSGDISHMLPSEAILLADEDFEMYFTVKWLEQKLMTYQTSGYVDEPQKGPVICMLDTSHSMRGSKLRLAQVFVMTFAALCLLERRDFYLLLFGAKGELVEQPLMHRKPDWQAFYSLSRMAFGGGTHFDAPLKRGIEIVQHTPSFRDADFVMVTDGVGSISSPVRDSLAQLGSTKHVRLHSLIIGSARQHLVQKYEILGVSHRVRFAANWETQGEENQGLLLDVFADAGG
ncbi:hypothetical protein PP175_06335 [Aneurinibacillus sp. Ricciae_BoGa-3]|uniref:hypothetical protein n=1 Tax=Aneurinibacillus sp. Ricciae_BoGa-3 TaxID=3022697 RepID=UPI002340914A|nr:hypothetical protein [Aneurinibacillus sp. Ricciae_BoGa-3]WCK55559.1 hypothetical protein PP175_06335 [Aneurinibacillus sp. Ricciae_BoGa-3]